MKKNNFKNSNQNNDAPKKKSGNYFEQFSVAPKKRKALVKEKNDFKLDNRLAKQQKRNAKDDTDFKPELSFNLKNKKEFLSKGEEPSKAEEMPLNKFLAHSGICSRREAVEIIKARKVIVNGEVKTEPGYKVQATDKIEYDGKTLSKTEKQVYYLLNKPKDFITTTSDEKGRKMILDFFKNVKERIYPVGRLDRNTTGLIILTNDGDLAQKLSHPKYECKKVYQVSLDKELSADDFEKIKKGVLLEDGLINVNDLSFIENKKTEIGLEIHSGRNRIVRRIFEHLGYEVKHLDRVLYAGLTKKNLPRGKFRVLTPREVVFLKHYK